MKTFYTQKQITNGILVLLKHRTDFVINEIISPIFYRINCKYYCIYKESKENKIGNRKFNLI